MFLQLWSRTGGGGENTLREKNVFFGSSSHNSLNACEVHIGTRELHHIIRRFDQIEKTLTLSSLMKIALSEKYIPSTSTIMGSF